MSIKIESSCTISLFVYAFIVFKLNKNNHLLYKSKKAEKSLNN